MIETEFTFFEMQEEVVASDAAAFGQPGLRGTPEALNAINVDAAPADEHAVPVFHAKVFAVAEVNQAVISDPAIRMNDAAEINAPANNAEQSRTFGVGDDLRIDPPLAL